MWEYVCTIVGLAGLFPAVFFFSSPERARVFASVFALGKPLSLL